MKIHTLIFISSLLISSSVLGSDTLYFRLSNPWNTVKSASGQYLRKCVKENDFYHVWDYNSRNMLVTESFYSDTNFTKKLFCHKYYDEKKGFLEQTLCYENGRLNGYFVSYDKNGDTTSYQVYNNGAVEKEWSATPQDDLPPFARNEEPAQFPGGDSAWQAYLNTNLNYPDSLQHIKGQVILRFKVGPKGTVESVEVIKSLHPALDKEAIRVIIASPKWIPAKQNGKKVPAYRMQPVSFG